MKRIMLLLLIFAVIFISSIFYQNYSYQSQSQNMERNAILLNNNMTNVAFTETIFIFIFNDHNKTVIDFHNLVDKVYGGLDEKWKSNIEIEIINNKRLVSITNGVILKTYRDSIDVGKSYVKLKGYMGIFDKEHRSFYVDKNGSFEINIKD